MARRDILRQAALKRRRAQRELAAYACRLPTGFEDDRRFGELVRRAARADRQVALWRR